MTSKFTTLNALYPPEQLAALSTVRAALLEDPTRLDNRPNAEKFALADGGRALLLNLENAKQET
jgi:hypothetical protein